MECNREEAVRAKEIAERKFKEKDYAGSKKFVSKAQNLYPELDGLDQMLVTIDVYVSAEKKLGEEADWYKILDVNPWADDETIKKQYRKLALLLHPDKNKSVGADGAFNLVLEAWSILSDKARRLAYNQRINAIGIQRRNPVQGGVSSVPPRANGTPNSRSHVTKTARSRIIQNRMGHPSATPQERSPTTFWTLCNRCKTQYEYLRIYLNHTLLCPNCQQAFKAVEKDPPSNVYRSPKTLSSQQQQNSGHHVTNSISFNRASNSSSSYTRTSVSAEAAHVQQAQERVKREREQAETAAGWGGSNMSWRMGNTSEGPQKRRKDDSGVNGYVGGVANQMYTGANVSESRRSILETQSMHGFSGVYQKPKSERELSVFEMRNMLVDKARTEICQKVNEWRSLAEAKMAKERDRKRNKGRVNGGLHGLDKHERSAVANHDAKSPPGTSSHGSVVEGPTLVSINVPDPDFHNFDLDRTEAAFTEDQVWAAYDDDDGMPRYYARIHKVISLKPFKIKLSWLNSRSCNEFGSMDWISSGFIKTCGEFRTGRHEISGSLNSFSYRVHWTKGVRGVICIYPKKGDVWAVYKNWSLDWNVYTQHDVIHKYEMVEVLDDYNKELGILVIPLIKIPSFRTVFRRNEDLKETRRIPKEEMFRFSHRVPNRLLTGQEAHNSPRGCHDLDPAATPLELLQVTNEASEAAVKGD